VIELYNSGPAAVDLSGMGLTDEFDTPYKFTFAASTTLGAGEYLVVIADTTKRSPLHTGFSLRREGDEVYLFARPGAGWSADRFGRVRKSACGLLNRP
jgi:hypothetical protein